MTVTEVEMKDDMPEKETTTTSLPKKQKEKEEKCKVIRYNPKEKTLDAMFKEYGIRIYNVESFQGETVIVKYKGEIGTKDFTYKL